MRLPIHRGLMITLGTAATSGRAAGDDDDDDDENENENDDDGRKYHRDVSARLNLHPQEDANLSEFHPNIYVPRAMLERPDLLVRYGGGGEE